MAPPDSLSVVVTGASGFIGRRLVAALRRAGHRPLVDRADVTDPGALQPWASARPDVVFHLAVSRDAKRAHAVNVTGTEHVLAAAGDARVVHVGGALEADADSPYGVSKAAATERALAGGAVVVRPTFVYGPGQDARKLIPTLLRAARTGEPVGLMAAAAVDWVYVDDVVDACLAAASPTVDGGTLVDVGSGEPHTPAEVADVVVSATGRPLRRRVSDAPPRAWDRARSPVELGPLIECLGVRPRGLLDGVSAMWNEQQ